MHDCPWDFVGDCALASHSGQRATPRSYSGNEVVYHNLKFVPIRLCGAEWKFLGMILQFSVTAMETTVINVHKFADTEFGVQIGKKDDRMRYTRMESGTLLIA